MTVIPYVMNPMRSHIMRGFHVLPQLLMAASLIVNLVLAWRMASGKTVALGSLTGLRHAPVPSAIPAGKGSLESGSPLGGSYSTDPRQLLANLRARGVPDPTIRAVVKAAVEELFRGRESMLLPLPSDMPWWQSRATVITPDSARELLALRREKSKLLEELLGPDPDAPMWQHEAGIPADIRMQAGSIDSDYDWLIKLQAGPSGTLLTEAEKATLAALRQDKANEMARLLSPEELTAFQAKKSDPFYFLQQELGSFVATDEERSSLSRYAEKSAASSGREALVREANEELRAAIGEARYREFDFNRRLQFRSLADLAQRAGLPTDRVWAVYDIWRGVDAESQRIRDDRGLDPSQQLLAMNQAATSARAGIQANLGPEVSAAFLAHAESWLSSIEKGNVVSFSSPGSFSSVPVWSSGTK